MTLNDVTFTVNWTEPATTDGNGGAFSVRNSTRSESIVEMTDCYIGKCVAKSSGAIFYVSTSLVGDNRPSSIKMTNCTLTNCFTLANGTSSGGNIRTVGVSYCTLEMYNCNVTNNYANAGSGGISWNAGRVDPLKLDGCTFNNNWTKAGGGALGLSSRAEITNCTITNNTAKTVGGGITYSVWSSGNYEEDFHPYDGDLVLDANTSIENNHAGTDGGGLWMDVSAMRIGFDTDHPYTVYTNVNGDPYSLGLSINGASIKNNTAGGNGGAICLRRQTDIYVSGIDLNYGTIESNTANNHGGGIYAYATTSGDRVPVTIGGSDAGTLSLVGNTTSTNHGGGLYVSNGNVRILGGKIGESGKPNSATGSGGGIYVTGSNSNVDIEGGTIAYNICNNNGGGIFINEASSTAGEGVSISGTAIIEHNEAGVSGAGLFINSTGNFSNGIIRNNTASTSGGGVYITSNGTLNISETAAITGNNATSGQGGGVYLNGNMTIDGDELNITGNTKGIAKATITNNVYLPNGKTIKVLGGIDPTGVNLGIYTENEAVEGGTDIPVLTADAENESKLGEIYNALLDGSSQITDDREVHKAKYPGAAAYTLYFTKISYDFGAFSDSEPFSNPINSPLQLYKYMCWVNGLNGFSTKHADAAGNVTADINMAGVNHWIPIGEKETASTDTDPFNGNFNGNGHIISNLSLTGIDDYTNYGLFGNITTNAIITDVNVQGCNFAKNEAGTMGTVVGLMQGGTVKNSLGSGSLNAAHADCIIGGLVGQMTAGNVHSSAAMSTLTGYQMGGLVGQLSSGSNLYNSFANAQFTEQTSNDKYMGGLVGVNNGRIENCYSRVRGAVPSARFGYLAGNNTSATNMGLYDCYAPNTPYVASGATAGTQSNLDTYNPVIAPYLYDHSNDNTLVNTSGTNLLDILNRWVEAPAHSSDGYSPWKRTTAGGYGTGSNINDDYPIHKFADYKCVASPDGITLDYAPHLYNILKRHASNATVNLYANDTTKASTGSNVVVYIDENISLLQNNTTSSIAAYTCQTIPGTPRSWHFLSSSLSNSGIGFNYGQSALFNWEPNPCHVTISNDDDAALFPSDLPMSGGYADVSKIDLYAFYEPEYHWINLKRNSNSHWHMNATNQPINYTNETTLTPGKGYLVSIDQDQLLQNRGTLNNGEVEIALGYTPAQEWAGLVGYNLIGNPYQSYLDFPAFASQNSGLWYDGSKGKAVEPTYAVYDSEMGGYIQYKEGASRGSKSASGILNMHQGFMVRSSGATRAKFTNAMRTNEGNGVSFRGEQPAYPLINLTVTDDKGVNDFAVLELGRYRDEGAEKLRANDSKGWLYLHHGSEDYGILFRSEVDDYQPLWFEADEAGSYTLSWETANAEFEALTLVDNITGVVTDMLAHDRYTFEATPEQYASRFKIVIGDYKDIEENEAPEPVEGPTFAYVNNGNIVLTGLETEGDASLQVIDMTGRVILCRDASHASAISTDGIASGIYVLRLTDGKGTKIQKIVIE